MGWCNYIRARNACFFVIASLVKVYSCERNFSPSSTLNYNIFINCEDIYLKFPNVLFYAIDFDENNTCFESLRSTHDITTIPDDIELYDTVQLQTQKQQTTFISIAKLNYFDQFNYKDLFYSLQILNKN